LNCAEGNTGFFRQVLALKIGFLTGGLKEGLFTFGYEIFKVVQLLLGSVLKLWQLGGVCYRRVITGLRKQFVIKGLLDYVFIIEHLSDY